MGPEIDISSELLERHIPALRAIAQLGVKYGPGRWVIVGGMMVMILGREYRARSPRAEGTKDADILVDIVSRPDLLADVVNFLIESMAYEPQDPVGDPDHAARCTLVSGSAQIDVLCPDDTPEPNLFVPERNVASIAIPGGRRALETARPVSLFYSDEHLNAEAYLPTLAGAIVTKVASALDARTAGSPRHLEDVGFLLTMSADPDEVRRQFTDADLVLLGRIDGYVADTRSPMWQQLDGRQRQLGQAMYQALLA